MQVNPAPRARSIIASFGGRRADRRGKEWNMSEPITMWHGEHLRFARLLEFLERQMTAFHDGEHPNYELMRDAVYYLHHYADRFHHPREDVAFARLAERDPDSQLAINRLLQEHRVISAAGDALLKHLEDILEDTVIERSAVEAAAATYLVYYRHHLATEEADIMPRAARALTPDDWAAVVAAVPAGPDPLFGDDIAARYRDIRRQIMREQ
jgi:hemerythrin-like domain-containing protein